MQAQQLKKGLFAAAFAAAAGALAACGGGGGGGSVTPSTPAPTISTGSGATTQATFAPPSTPVPTSTATAAPTSSGAATISGKAVDASSGAGLAGYTVAIATYETSASPSPIATTASDGSFSAATNLAGSTVLLVVSPPSSAAYSTYHGSLKLGSGTTSAGNVTLTALSSEEQSEITLINSDRASHGAGPVIPDTVAMTVARYHAQDMAGLTGLGSPYFAHNDRTGLTPQQRYANAGGIGSAAENLCVGWPTPYPYSSCEAGYLAEGPPPAGSSNHYSTLISTAVWVGVGTANGALFTSAGTQAGYFDEEFGYYP